MADPSLDQDSPNGSDTVDIELAVIDWNTVSEKKVRDIISEKFYYYREDNVQDMNLFDYMQHDFANMEKRHWKMLNPKYGMAFGNTAALMAFIFLLNTLISEKTSWTD